MKFDVVPRAKLGDEAWDAAVERHPSGWFFHTSRWLDYCLACRGLPPEADRSCALLNSGHLAGLIPLVDEGGDGEVAFTMGGEPGAAPLLFPPDDAALATATNTAVQLAGGPSLRRVAFRGHPGADVAALSGYDAGGWNTQVLDLRPEEDALFRGLRKSYRQIVRREEQREEPKREVVVYGPPGRVVMETARQLHIAEAGRETRPLRTWDLMGDWLRDGFALLAFVSGGEGQTDWAGYAYTLRWKGWAYYASGATVERDVAHLLQWALIKALRCDGRTHYELGWWVRPGEEADHKAAGIARFKQGFGGEPWRVATATRTFTAREGPQHKG